jgi:hypothetical protein
MSRYPIDDRIDKTIEADPIELDIDEFDEPSGSPLSPEEIAAAGVSLALWQSPDAFKAAVDALCTRCVSKDWFNSPQLKFLHDAFVLARFACRQRLEEVRLAESLARWPDGFARINATTNRTEDGNKPQFASAVSLHSGRRGRPFRKKLKSNYQHNRHRLGRSLVATKRLGWFSRRTVAEQGQHRDLDARWRSFDLLQKSKRANRQIR